MVDYTVSISGKKGCLWDQPSQFKEYGCVVTQVINLLFNFFSNIDCQLSYLLKLISGKVEYSDLLCCAFLLGNVQKNALASRLAICCCVKLIEWFCCLRSRGIPYTKKNKTISILIITFIEDRSKAFLIVIHEPHEWQMWVFSNFRNTQIIYNSSKESYK